MNGLGAAAATGRRLRDVPRLLAAAAVFLAIAAVLAIAGFVFDTWELTGLRMDDLMGWVCLFAGLAIVLAIASRVRGGRAASIGQRRGATAIVALAAIPIVVVAIIVAILIAL